MQVGVGVGEAQPAGFAVEARHRLGHGQGDQFRIGQPGRPATPARGLQVVIDMHVQCGQEGVQLGRHNPMLDTLPTPVNPAIGTTRLAVPPSPRWQKVSGHTLSP